jgi:CoA binding domain
MPEPVDDAAGPGLQKLLAPRSIAIVGTSTRPGTFGNGLVRRVLKGGFPGPVHLVNPWYEQVEGLRCVPALAELPGPADLALLAVRAEHVEAQLPAAAGTGPGPRSSTPSSSTIRARMPGWPRVASAVVYRFKTRRRDAELRFGLASRLRQDRGSCPFVCCI